MMDDAPSPKDHPADVAADTSTPTASDTPANAPVVEEEAPAEDVTAPPVTPTVEESSFASSPIAVAGAQAMAFTDLPEPESLEFARGAMPNPEPGGAPRDVAEAMAVLAGLVFATTQPLSINRLQALTGGLSPDCLRRLLGALHRRLMPFGLEISEVGGGFQMATAPATAEWVWRLSRKKTTRLALSQSALETLAIVAYKQPVTKSEVDVIRGMDSGQLLRHLVELELLEVAGRKEVPGRPILYGTTTHFLRTFGLARVGDLPAVRELKRIYGEREKKRAENEEQHARARRDAERRAALEKLKKYRPPITELARPLTEAERAALTHAGAATPESEVTPSPEPNGDDEEASTGSVILIESLQSGDRDESDASDELDGDDLSDLDDDEDDDDDELWDEDDDEDE
jgi:segregation and condensation protein B